LVPAGRQLPDVLGCVPSFVGSRLVLFTMPTMARLMLTRKMNVTVMPRKNMRQSRYLAAMRSVGKTVRFNVSWYARRVIELHARNYVWESGGVAPLFLNLRYWTVVSS
jgi:hypothetical protein